MPKRIQRKRSKGWKMPENTVYVGRPTRWGNPYHVGSCYFDDETGQTWEHITRETATEFYQEAILHHYPSVPFSVEDIVRELKGMDLACWCKPGDTCHADVLLQIANGGGERSR